jgi:hypothetical protein
MNDTNNKAEDNMIEILTDFSDNVVAAAAHGVVTKRDYEDAIVPRVELALIRRFAHFTANARIVRPHAEISVLVFLMRTAAVPHSSQE